MVCYVNVKNTFSAATIKEKFTIHLLVLNFNVFTVLEARMKTSEEISEQLKIESMGKLQKHH